MKTILVAVFASILAVPAWAGPKESVACRLALQPYQESYSALRTRYFEIALTPWAEKDRKKLEGHLSALKPKVQAWLESFRKERKQIPDSRADLQARLVKEYQDKFNHMIDSYRNGFHARKQDKELVASVCRGDSGPTGCYWSSGEARFLFSARLSADGTDFVSVEAESAVFPRWDGCASEGDVRIYAQSSMDLGDLGVRSKPALDCLIESATLEANLENRALIGIQDGSGFCAYRDPKRLAEGKERAREAAKTRVAELEALAREASQTFEVYAAGKMTPADRELCRDDKALSTAAQASQLTKYAEEEGSGIPGRVGRSVGIR